MGEPVEASRAQLPTTLDAPDPGSVSSCQSLGAAEAAAAPKPAGGSHLQVQSAERFKQKLDLAAHMMLVQLTALCSWLH